MINFKEVSIDLIDTSPYQRRRYFSEKKLQELANSLLNDGLIEPVVVRFRSVRYQLIAGERRLRASRIAQLSTILARIVDVSDLQARRMCAAENMQREDLSVSEEIEAIVEIIDAEFIEDDYYQLFGDDPITRVTRFLRKRETTEKHNYVNTVNEFIDRIDIIMSGLPRPKDWLSFLHNDLPFLDKIDEDVLDLAARIKARKTKAEALQNLKKELPGLFNEIVLQIKEIDDSKKMELSLSLFSGKKVSLFDASANDLNRICSVVKSLTIRSHYNMVQNSLSFNNKKYQVFYADPPWQYADRGLDDYGHAERHYNTMSLQDICELGKRIKELRDDNAVLFLWVTSPFLEDSFEVISAWGFKYKTSFVWDKVKHNHGHYNSVRHEFLLVCTYNSCTPDVKKLFDSVQVVERDSYHSGKPQCFREIIETLYPSRRKLEIFARNRIENWDVWGDEVNND